MRAIFDVYERMRPSHCNMKLTKDTWRNLVIHSCCNVVRNAKFGSDKEGSLINTKLPAKMVGVL